jgi:hypothetical protein
MPFYHRGYTAFLTAERVFLNTETIFHCFKILFITRVKFLSCCFSVQWVCGVVSVGGGGWSAWTDDLLHVILYDVLPPASVIK